MIRVVFNIVIIMTLFLDLTCFNKKVEKSEEKILPIYGIWNPVGYTGYINAYTEYGLFKSTDSSLSIWPSSTREKEQGIKDEIGIIHDMGTDIRIIGISGVYPEYRIKFKSEQALLNEKGEYNNYNTWINGELIIHFINKDEIWFELVKFDLERDNLRYEEIMKSLKNFIKFGNKNIYRRAEKIDRPIPETAP